MVRDGKAHIQTVKLVASASDRVQVIEGLQAGEQVVLEGMDSLRDGSRVKIVAPVEGDPDALLGGTPDEAAGKPAPAGGNDQPAGEAGPGGDAPLEP